VIVANGVPYVVDCGDGVARQLVLADVPLPALRHIFITHQHSDHTADYGNLMWLAWAAGLRTRIDTWGPPPLDEMTRLFFQMNAADINTRIADEGRVCVLELELDGALRVQEEVPGSVTIFIAAPVEELERRLRERATESTGEIGDRITLARRQLEQAHRFRYMVRNDDVHRATEVLTAIVERELVLGTAPTGTIRVR